MCNSHQFTQQGTITTFENDVEIPRAEWRNPWEIRKSQKAQWECALSLQFSESHISWLTWENHLCSESSARACFLLYLAV